MPKDSATPPHRVLALLTEAQLECLQLVRQRKTAKQIARTLNISHHAVEQRLKSARRKLGVDTTAEAIDLIEEAERVAYGETVYGLPDVARLDPDWAPEFLSPPNRGDSGTEIMTAFSPVTDEMPANPSSFDKLVEVLVGDAGAMSWQSRLVFMAISALVAVIIVILLVSFIEGLSRLAT